MPNLGERRSTGDAHAPYCMNRSAE